MQMAVHYRGEPIGEILDAKPCLQDEYFDCDCLPYLQLLAAVARFSAGSRSAVRRPEPSRAATAG